MTRTRGRRAAAAAVVAALTLAAPVAAGGSSRSAAGPQPILQLGPPTRILPPEDLSMSVPDMHTAIVQGPKVCPSGGRDYCLYATGVIGGVQGRGSTALITTTNLVQASAYAVPTGVTEPVFKPPCRGDHAPFSCRDLWDAGYRGANFVFKAPDGTWRMIYHGETRTFGTASDNHTYPHTPAFAEIGLAISRDGIGWTSQGTIVSGSDPKPSLSEVTGRNGLYGTPEPGALVQGGEVYVFFPYIPSPGSPDASQPGRIEAARASLSSMADGRAGTWFKYADHAWKGAGLGGVGAAVVPAVPSCTNQDQPWVGYSATLERYVMAFLCRDGWFLTTATDLASEDWTTPVEYYKAPVPEFTQGQPTDDNAVLVSPGYASPTIGGQGYVLYAHAPDWGTHDRQRTLWYRTFTLTTGLPKPPGGGCPPQPPGRPNPCK